MPDDLPKKYEHVPPESIVALVFIGVVVVGGLIARCLALNHSTIRSAQSSDLVIYQAAPRQVPAAKARRSSLDVSFDSNNDTRDHKVSFNEATIPVRIQRGPKNL